MADLILKRSDVGGTVDIPLEYWNYKTDRWVAIDLTLAQSCKFVMRGSLHGVEAGSCVALDPPTDGIVRVTFDADDLQYADDYNAEVKIFWPGGSKETVPNGASGLPIDAPGQIYLSVTVLEDIVPEPA